MLKFSIVTSQAYFSCIRPSTWSNAATRSKCIHKWIKRSCRVSCFLNIPLNICIHQFLCFTFAFKMTCLQLTFFLSISKAKNLLNRICDEGKIPESLVSPSQVSIIIDCIKSCFDSIIEYLLMIRLLSSQIINCWQHKQVNMRMRIYLFSWSPTLI